MENSNIKEPNFVENNTVEIPDDQLENVNGGTLDIFDETNKHGNIGECNNERGGAIYNSGN